MVKRLIHVLLVIVSIATFVIVGWYFLIYQPQAQDFRALCATQFLQLPTSAWHADYQRQTKSLPAPYPRSIAEMVTYGYTDQATMDFYGKQAELRYHAASDGAPDDFLLVEAETPRGIWNCTLGFDRKWVPKK